MSVNEVLAANEEVTRVLPGELYDNGLDTGMVTDMEKFGCCSPGEIL